MSTQILSPDSDNLKRCSVCSELKPRAEFGKDARAKDGYQSACRRCHAASSARYYAQHKEDLREWRNANPEIMKARYRNHRVKFAEQINEYASQYRTENREVMRERSKRWRAAHPEQVREQSFRRRARKAGNGGAYTEKELASVRAAQTDKRGRLICWRCGKPIKGNPHLDHWMPIKRGGTNSAGNLHYMHAHCNLTKHAKHPTDIGRLI